MGRDAIPKDLRASLREALGAKIKVELARMVQADVRPDRVELRVLALSAYRLYLITTKSPSKVEISMHFLDINLLDSKTVKKLTVGTSDGKRFVVSFEDEAGKDTDLVIGFILQSVAATFPAKSVENFITNLDIKPTTRLKDFYDKLDDTKRHGEEAPCGNFSAMYRCCCDYFGVEFMEDVAWDIDTIYLSHGSKELNLSDFDHLEARQMVPIISSLEHNVWFTSFNASNMKLSADAVNELLKVVKTNTAIEKLLLHNIGIKYEFLQRLSSSLQANTGSSLTVIDLSDNTIDDRGLSHLCASISKLPHGLVELNLSRTSLTARGINRLAEVMQGNRSIASSLKQLDLSYNGLKAEDLTNLCNFLAQPNSLTHLCLGYIDYPLEHLFAALLRGCTQNLTHLDLSGNFYRKPLMRETVVPNTWKQFFSSSSALQSISFANDRLPAEAVKCVLLGIASNVTLKDVELNLSGNALGTSGAQVLEVCLPAIGNIATLDLSDNGFDTSLSSVMGKMSQNRSIRKLCLGRNLNGVRPKQVPPIMEALVKLIQQEGSTIECLMLDDMRLKADTTIFINALGLNCTLTQIDISGNLMGDIGARMLSKALQINKKLSVVHWDHNNTSPNGFQDIAMALEKNFTVREMPTPVNDAAAALRINQAKTEQALRKIESLLQRNHSPRKFAAEQEYRLQQGFFTSSSQQMDAVIVQLQDTVSKLEKIDNLSSESKQAISRTNEVIKDAAASRQLLLELQKVAYKSDGGDDPIQQSLKSFATQLTTSVEKSLKETVTDMVHCAETHCPHVLENKELLKSLQESSHDLVKIPPGFVQGLLMEQVGTDILNKTGEINLSVATHVSDRVMDEVTDTLENLSLVLDKVLRTEAKSSGLLDGNDAQAAEMRKCLLRSSNIVSSNVSSTTDEDQDTVSDEITTVPKKDRNRSMYNRTRPQSAIDPSDVQRALALKQQNDEAMTQASASCHDVSNAGVGEPTDNGVAASNQHKAIARVCSSDPRDQSASADESEQVLSPVPLPRKRKGLSTQINSTDFDVAVKTSPGLPQPPLATGKEHPLPKPPHELVSERVRETEVNEPAERPDAFVKNGSTEQRHADEAVAAPKRTESTKVKPPSVSSPPVTDLLPMTAPKLNHLGANRPRRLKTKAVTRPNVGLPTADEPIEEQETGVIDVFFATPDIGAVIKPAEPTTVNGEPEKPKDTKKPPSITKQDSQKSSGGFGSAFMSLFKKKDPELQSPKPLASPTSLVPHEEVRQKTPDLEQNRNPAPVVTKEPDDTKVKDKDGTDSLEKKGAVPKKAMLPPGKVPMSDVMAEMRKNVKTTVTTTSSVTGNTGPVAAPRNVASTSAVDDDSSRLKDQLLTTNSNSAVDNNRQSRFLGKKVPPPPLAPKPPSAKNRQSLTDEPADQKPDVSEKVDRNSNITPGQTPGDGLAKDRAPEHAPASNKPSSDADAHAAGSPSEHCPSPGLDVAKDSDDPSKTVGSPEVTVSDHL